MNFFFHIILAIENYHKKSKSLNQTFFYDFLVHLPRRCREVTVSFLSLCRERRCPPPDPQSEPFIKLDMILELELI